MKRINVLAMAAAVIMLLGGYASSAFAFGDVFDVLNDYFGISGKYATGTDADVTEGTVTTNGNAQVDIDSSLSSMILQGIIGGAFNTVSNAQLTDILNQLDINVLLGGDSSAIDEILELIGNNHTRISGDVDGDGELTSGDARLALRASVKLENYKPGSAQFLAADADGSGEIESGDARLILRASVKLEDPAKFGKRA